MLFVALSSYSIIIIRIGIGIIIPTNLMTGAGAAATAATAFAGGSTAENDCNKGGDNFHRLYDEGEEGIFDVAPRTRSDSHRSCSCRTAHHG